uniref:SCHIP-1 domain-containing protein n=1 Tax=Rhabditophanes sp. KR3021 TaxID=114890 RepID=A0AC35UGI7_9BILA
MSTELLADPNNNNNTSANITIDTNIVINTTNNATNGIGDANQNDVLFSEDKATPCIDEEEDDMELLISMKLNTKETMEKNICWLTGNNVESTSKLSDLSNEKDNECQDGSSSCSEYSYQVSGSSFQSNDWESSEEETEPEMGNDVIGLANDELQCEFETKSLCESIKSRQEEIKESVLSEIEKIDCKLPDIDFVKLEQSLIISAKEHEMNRRRQLGNEVRRRLALESELLDDQSFPAVNRYPLKSNLAERLHTANNLQLCYMNELCLDNRQAEDDYFENNAIVPKSKSAPNLKGVNSYSKILNGYKFDSDSKGNSCISECRKDKHCESGQIKRLSKKQQLINQTNAIVKKAKESAKLQLAYEKKIGHFVLTKSLLPKKVSRAELTKINNFDLEVLLEDLQDKVDDENGKLVKYLIERDALHMEQDSIMCDIDDLIYKACLESEVKKLPNFIPIETTKDPMITKPKRVTDESKQNVGSTGNQNHICKRHLMNKCKLIIIRKDCDQEMETQEDQKSVSTEEAHMMEDSSEEYSSSDDEAMEAELSISELIANYPDVNGKNNEWMRKILIYLNGPMCKLHSEIKNAMKAAMTTMHCETSNKDDFYFATNSIFWMFIENNEAFQISQEKLQVEKAQLVCLTEICQHCFDIFGFETIEPHTLYFDADLPRHPRLLILYGDDLRKERDDIYTMTAAEFKEKTNIELVYIKCNENIKILNIYQFYSIFKCFPHNPDNSGTTGLH